MDTLLHVLILTSCSFVPAESATLGLADKSRFLLFVTAMC